MYKEIKLYPTCTSEAKSSSCTKFYSQPNLVLNIQVNVLVYIIFQQLVKILTKGNDLIDM
jgi:hypothetical protein